MRRALHAGALFTFGLAGPAAARGAGIPTFYRRQPMPPDTAFAICLTIILFVSAWAAVTWLSPGAARVWRTVSFALFGAGSLSVVWALIRAGEWALPPSTPDAQRLYVAGLAAIGAAGLIAAGALYAAIVGRLVRRPR